MEKPREPVSKLANIGLYWIRDTAALWRGIDRVLAAPANQGEFYLTDAFQGMIEEGRRILAAEVGGWYDCGAPNTLLEANGILLAKGAARHRALPGVTFHDPVLVEDGALVERSEVGPNVTIAAGARVRDSVLRHAIVGRDATLDGVQLERALLGDRVALRGVRATDLSLGADSTLTGPG